MSLESCKSIGDDVCQIFVRNNMQWCGKPISPLAVSFVAQPAPAPGPCPRLLTPDFRLDYLAP